MGPVGWSINTEDAFEIGGLGQHNPIKGLHQMYQTYYNRTNPYPAMITNW